jgi:hypothetical protein
MPIPYGKGHANPKTSGNHVLGFFVEISRGKKLKAGDTFTE